MSFLLVLETIALGMLGAVLMFMGICLLPEIEDLLAKLDPRKNHKDETKKN